MSAVSLLTRQLLKHFIANNKIDLFYKVLNIFCQVGIKSPGIE